MTPPTSTEPIRAYICLGSNIRPVENIALAVARLDELVEVTMASHVYESAAKGAADAPRFLNAAVTILTELDPAALKFELLRPIEAELGRVRTANPNEPRTIDIDLALFGDRVVDDADRGVVLPDPDILECAHVALPLADLAPELAHPVTGEPLSVIAGRLAAMSDIRRVDEPRLPHSGGRHRPNDRATR